MIFLASCSSSKKTADRSPASLSHEQIIETENNLNDLPQDKKLSETVRAKCQKGYSLSCLNAGDLLYKHYTKESLSYKYWLRACDLYDPRGCIKARNWALTSGDIDMANSLLEKSCQLKSGEACYLMGKKKPEHLLTYLSMSCYYGYVKGCHEGGHAHFNERFFAKGLELLRRSCDEGLARSCFEAAVSSQKLGRADWESDFYKQACQRKYVEGCYALGVLEIKNKAYPQAIRWLQLAVQYGFWEWNIFDYDSLFDPLRPDPNFSNLISGAKINAQNKMNPAK